MKIVLLLCALALGAVAQTGRFGYPPLSPPWPKTPRPAWLQKGTVFVGNWEPLQWAYRKNWQQWGNTRTGANAEKLHKEDRTEEVVIALKNMGVNMVFTSFHKGFGIENEKFNMEEARDYAKILHKHGLKMALYVSALLIYEDLYGEFPEAQDWHRRFHDSTPDHYFHDGYRYRAYLNHPQYIDYMKRVCDLAVKYGADAIFFDTVRQITPENHHPLAEKMFRDWLKRRYPTPEGWFFRAGLKYYDYVKIPHFTDPLQYPAHDQTIIQEYIHFKNEQIADFAAEFTAFTRKLNPEVAIWFNTGGITGGNTAWLFNIDLGSLLPWLDVYYTEDRDEARYTEQGGIVSKIRSIKAGKVSNSIHTNAAGQPPPIGERALDPPRDDPRLRLAEAMAFNRLSLGNIGYGAKMVTKEFPDTGRRYVKFFRDNFDNLLGASDSAAEVAVVRTFASMSFNQFDTHRETMLAEQALIQDQIPFDYIFDQNFADIAKYKVLVLGNQESLSDKQVEALRAYVKNGGGIVATFNTSIYDDWRRQRDQFGLSDVFGLDHPTRAAEKAAKQNEFGKGRSAYLLRFTPSIPIPPRAQTTVMYWAPPKNAAEFTNAVRWAGRLTWNIDAPPFVAAEVCYQKAKDRYVLHLVNYNAEKQPSVDNVQFTYKLPGYSKITAVSPDEGNPVALTASKAQDGFAVKLPKLGIYSILTIEK